MLANKKSKKRFLNQKINSLKGWQCCQTYFVISSKMSWTIFLLINKFFFQNHEHIICQISTNKTVKYWKYSIYIGFTFFHLPNFDVIIKTKFGCTAQEILSYTTWLHYFNDCCKWINCISTNRKSLQFTNNSNLNQHYSIIFSMKLKQKSSNCLS